MDDLVGNPIYEKFGNFFPLLIKFIDANDKLSVQVHPNDDLAFEEHGTFGKTEMWYIMQANEGAGLYIGFNKELNASELKKIIENNKIEEVLNFVPVKEGDVVFLPAGRIHAIGAGLLIAEIQQTSDITYRLYDWNRVDQNGKPRQLHIEQALKAIDYSFIQEPKINYQILPNNSVELVSCQYFTTNIIEVTTTIEKDYGYIDSFVVLICVKGKVMIEPYLQESVELNIGETILIPEEINNLYIKPFENSTLLEIYIK